MKRLIYMSALLALASCADNYSQKSPDGDIAVDLNPDSMSLTISYAGRQVMEIPALGITTSRGEGRMTLDSISSPSTLTERYEMLAGKRRLCSNEATERVLYMSDADGNRQNIRLRVYNDGVAFRYELDSLNGVRLAGEQTEYLIPNGTRRWIQKWTEPYEAFFPMDTTGTSKDGHWGYPALMTPDGNAWCLISEANIERRQSASSLRNDGSPERYRVWPDENTLELNGEWHTPWRTLIVGSLADVVESTLITDLSEPSKIEDTSWINPGTVSWIYWAYNHGSNDYQIVKRYIDMGAELNLPYMLIDAEWDEMGNGGNIEDALKYASQSGVKPLVWYNSSTAWINNGAPGPMFRLNAPADRAKEFRWLKDNGGAGVKIDFFSGDRQSTMDYCMDLIESAADHRLLVNFHGATIPRGWQRTYPHMLTVEAVYGAEWYNNAPVLTNRAACHNATLPFTRNVIGPMDYTPVTFSDSQHPHITTNAHELALSVVFESALQHLADRPESYLTQPDEVKKFLTALPTTWDDTRLLSGYPGEYVVMARQKGSAWYIGALNGTDEEKVLDIDWSRIPGASDMPAEIIEDGDSKESPWKFTTAEDGLPTSIACRPRGGFIIRLTPRS